MLLFLALLSSMHWLADDEEGFANDAVDLNANKHEKKTINISSMIPNVLPQRDNSDKKWDAIPVPKIMIEPCQIQDLDISWNLLGHNHSVVKVLARMLSYNTSLLRLDVGYNWFDPHYPKNIGVVERPRQSLETIIQGLSNNRTLLDFFIEGTSAVMDPLGFLSLRGQQLDNVVEASKAQRIAHIMPPSNAKNDWLAMDVTLDRRDKRWIKSNNPGWIAGGWSEVTIEWSPGSSIDSSKFDHIEIDMRLSLDNFSPTRMTKSRAGEDVGITGGNWLFTSTRVLPPGDLLYFFTVSGKLEVEVEVDNNDTEELVEGTGSEDLDSDSGSSNDSENEKSRTTNKLSVVQTSEVVPAVTCIPVTTEQSDKKNPKEMKSKMRTIKAFIAKDQPKVSCDVSFEPEILLPMDRANYVYVEPRVGPLLLMKVQPRKPLDEPILGEIKMVSWRLNTSVFSPRERTSDGRAFLDTQAIYTRACHADLAHCRLERLFNASVLQALEEALLLHYNFLTKYIRVQMCRSGSPHVFSINDLPEWAIECRLLIKDQYSYDDVLEIWKLVKETSISVAEDSTLMTRAEFLQLLVRIAIDKYALEYKEKGGKNHYIGDQNIAGDAFDALIELHLEMRIGELQIADPHEFRIRELYKPNVDAAFRRRLDILKLSFASWARELHTALTYEEFYNNFVLPATLSGKLQLSTESTRAAFGMSKMTVVDEKMIMLADGHSHFALKFEDFLECLAR
jgi:hypothetical protein